MKFKIMLLSLVSVLALMGCGQNPSSLSEGSLSISKEISISSEPTFELNENIKKINVVADDVGIYGVVISLSDKIADKGDLEFLFKGPKGSAQENSIVATFTLNYWTEPTGYEIVSFYNNEVYQNVHKLKELKYTIEFGASVRGGDVTVNYTPDGGTKQQIFYSDKACSYHN